MKYKIFFKDIAILLIFSLVIIACSSDNSEDEYHEEKIDNSLIEGVWQQVFQKDSLIFIFENNLAKKYIIDRNTLKLMERVDYGGYGLYKRDYNDGRTYHLLHIRTDGEYIKIGYKLNKDTLRIGYWSLTLTKI